MHLWPFLLYSGAVAGLVAAMIGISHLLGERHRGRATGEPYESGIVPTGGARTRFPAHFYLIAVFFVIFDLEAVFLFAWAVSARGSGWAGYAEAMTFAAVLLAALFYLWRVGGLDWGPRSRLSAGRSSAP